MTKMHCDGCDAIITEEMTYMQLRIGVWKGEVGQDLEQTIDVCGTCVWKNPLLVSIAQEDFEWKGALVHAATLGRARTT